MVLTLTPGSLNVTGTVANLFPSQTTVKTYATGINFHELQAGDAIEITIFWNDPQLPGERIYDQFIVTGVQTKPGVYIPPIPTGSYRVTARTSLGTNRTITWERKEYT